MGNCPLKDQEYNGNCTSCNSREYCMLNEILDKVRNLENALTRLQTKPVDQLPMQ